MGERIVIEDKEISKVCEDCGEFGEGCIMKENCKNKNTFAQAECCFNLRYTPKFKIEKYPTTFEELKELCKDEDISRYDAEILIKLKNGNVLSVYKEGDVYVEDECNDVYLLIGEDRTPAQMWQTIQSMTEENNAK